MTRRRHLPFIVLTAALLAAFAVFAFSPAALTDHGAYGHTSAASADHGCPDDDCADVPATGDISCCAGAACSGVWLASQAPVAGPVAFVRDVLTIPPGRLAAGVGAPPDPRPPRSFV